jgi:hypothetical protein
MRRWSGLPGIRIWYVVVLVLASVCSFFPEGANAGTVLLRTIVRIDNMNASSATTGSVCFQPANTATITQISVTFPTGFTVSSTAGNWTVSTSQPGGVSSGQNYWPSGVASWPGGTLAYSSTSSQTVNFSVSPGQSLTSANLYCFRWTNSAAITNPAAAVDLEGSVSTYVAGPTLQDSNNFALTVLACASAPCGDNVTINATVPPIFEMTLSRNTISFGTNLAYATVNASENNPTPANGRVDATVITNARGGWIMWAREDPGDPALGLTSTTTSHTIPTVGWNTNAVTTESPGTAEQDALDVTTLPAIDTHCTTAGPLAVDPEYNTAGTPGSDGGAFTADYAEIGTCAGGVSNGDGLRLSNHVAIKAITPAATDYTQTIDVVGAGNF